MNIISAIDSLRPNSGYSLKTNKYEDIEWHDKNSSCPTREEIQAKIAELQSQYEANQYQRDRQPEYPSIQDQLDMQYWDKVNGTNNWQQAIQAVKMKHPKPEND